MPDSACASFNPHIADAQTDSMGRYSVLDPEIYTGACGFSVSGSWACMHFTRTEVRYLYGERPFALSCAL